MVNGVQITQKSIRPGNTYEKCIASKIQIKVSTDQQNWQDATHVMENTLGNTSGENTIIKFPSSKNVRYVKFIINDLPYNSIRYTISLGKIKLF